MIFKKTPIEGLLILEPKVFGDERGFFLGSFRQDLIEEQGLGLPFVQANTSRSARGGPARAPLPDPQAAGEAGPCFQGQRLRRGR